MREIKFRGKTKDKGILISGNLSMKTKEHIYDLKTKKEIKHTKPYVKYRSEIITHYYIEISKEDYGCIYYEYIEIIPETVGQFIGRYDKEKKEIYEGDKIREIYGNKKRQHTSPHYTIVWNKYKARFDMNGWDIPFNITEAYEVVGNIYEDGDLLGK